MTPTWTENAISLAVRCHRGQSYGDGPYVLHPLRVLAQVSSWYSDDAVRAAAVLHDCVEDSPLTIRDLYRFGYPDLTCELVDLVTERTPAVAEKLGVPVEDREGYCLRASSRPESCAIKLADSSDHLDHLHECAPELGARRARKWGKERQLWWAGCDGHVRPVSG